jgi:hypothetical protein
MGRSRVDAIFGTRAPAAQRRMAMNRVGAAQDIVSANPAPVMPMA